MAVAKTALCEKQQSSSVSVPFWKPMSATAATIATSSSVMLLSPLNVGRYFSCSPFIRRCVEADTLFLPSVQRAAQ